MAYTKLQQFSRFSIPRSISQTPAGSKIFKRSDIYTFLKIFGFMGLGKFFVCVLLFCLHENHNLLNYFQCCRFYDALTRKTCLIKNDRLEAKFSQIHVCLIFSKPMSIILIRNV